MTMITNNQLADQTVTILGINGHLGHAAAKAFLDAGWTVRGFGRTNRKPLTGVTFIAGNADNVADIKLAVADSAVVVNALNLQYDQWDGGRLEAFYNLVTEAVMAPGRTMLFPGNIYNFAAGDRVITPQTRELPHVPRGDIRKRVEADLRHVAEAGKMQILILRAGDFFGPGMSGDWFGEVIMRGAKKGRIAVMADPEIAHTWAFLPDLGRAFVRLAEVRAELSAFDRLHFAGHFATQAELAAAIQKQAPSPLKVVNAPWRLLGMIGLMNGVIREIIKMRYLWNNPMALKDERLDAILGADFDTPFEDAVAEVVAPYFTKHQNVA